MSTAVYRKVLGSGAGGRVKVFEQTRIYREASGAAPKELRGAFTAQPLHFALDSAVTEVKFLQSETLQAQPVNLTLTNKMRDTDPYLTPLIRKLTKVYFP